MSFFEICEAARHQDARRLKTLLAENSIDLWKPGSYHFSAVSQMVVEDNQCAIDFLISYGAGIHYAAVGAALVGNQSYADELIAKGAQLNLVGMYAAQGGHFAYADDLKTRGAHLDDILFGTLIGMCTAMDLSKYNNYCDYVDKLLLAGANKLSLIRGLSFVGKDQFPERWVTDPSIVPISVLALQVGHNDFVEKLIASHQGERDLVAPFVGLSGNKAWAEHLIARGADITLVAQGVARRGHTIYVHELIQRGADMDVLAYYAAGTGHVQCANELIKKNADLQQVASGLVYCLSNSISLQTEYFYQFDYACLEKLVAAYNQLCFKNKHNCISQSNFNRIAALATLRENNYTYRLALARTNIDLPAGLMLLSKAVMHRKHFLDMPLEIWHKIFSFLMPIPLNFKETKELGFLEAKTQLDIQLAVYSSSRLRYWRGNAFFRDTAISLRKALRNAPDKNHWVALIQQQGQQLKTEYSCPSEDKKKNYPSSQDRYPVLIRHWHREVVDDLYAEEKNEIAAESNWNCTIQ